MMTQASAQNTKFVRRTILAPEEYRVNFRQIDCDVIGELGSSAARRVTPLMSHIYLSLVNAPQQYWERDGVLRFAGVDRDGQTITAWQQLREISDVANSTLSKALAWMHEQGLIGYSSGRNGVGIRIFINRAIASIRQRRPEKNLRLVQTPSDTPHTPSDGVPFKEEFSKKNLEADIDPSALTRSPGTNAAFDESPPAAPASSSSGSAPSAAQVIYLDDVLRQFRAEVSETVAAVCSREVERTREWLEKAGLPKAVRVAQHETYQVLRSLGIVEKSTKATGKAKAKVGISSPTFDLNPKETIKLWVDLAQSVRGIPLDEMLTEYVAGGDMSSDEARSILREAKALGLWEMDRELTSE